MCLYSGFWKLWSGLLLLLFITRSHCDEILSPEAAGSTPVIYISFRKTANYVRFNVELAARNNHVVVIEENPQQLGTVRNPSVSNFSVTYVKLDNYMSSASKFAPLYVHLSRNNLHYEKNCFLRWFVLMDFMKRHNIARAFYGDGDSSVFASMNTAYNMRSNCDACINIERQSNKLHWVGAGESSLWTVPALEDFCAFTLTVYKDYFDTLRIKAKRSFVVDMSLLWLWWVRNKMDKQTGVDTGRAFDEQGHSSTDEAFEFSKTLRLPNVNKSLKLCNGLDVVNRTSFDHFRGWTNDRGFTFDVSGGAVPYFIGATTKYGGQPESQDPAHVEQLKLSKLYLLNIHYQSDSKAVLPHDVCKVLLFTGSRSFLDQEILKMCLEVTGGKALKDIPCVVHDNNICY